jgi:hypothetical protein
MLPTNAPRLVFALLPAFVAAALACAPASAHEFWLGPASYRAAPRAGADSILVAAYVGTGFRGDFMPYAPTHTVRLELRAEHVGDIRNGAVNGDYFLAAVRPDAGGALISYETTFTPIELPAADFQAYLALEGLDDVLAARRDSGAAAKPGRERFRRCAKTWIAGSDTARATRPVGLSLEIVPATDPARPGPLGIRLLFGGKPLAHALVRAWNQPRADPAAGAPFEAAKRDSVGPLVAVRTDDDGRATLALDRAGEWLVSSVHMEPSADPAAADWESSWASFTFARRDAR